MLAARMPLFVVCLILAGCVAPPSPVPPAPREAMRASPRKDKFWWGVSTSAYQNEDRGEVIGEPGYFETDWDEFAKEGLCPPRGEAATSSWTNFEKDLAALRVLGVTHYRFGIEWARIEPQQGKINRGALARYVRMARRVREVGMVPIVTLWHFTFPSWAYNPSRKAASNFLFPGIEDAWLKHVGRTVKALSPYVKIWVPQNEANGLLPLGYLGGHWPPGLAFRPALYKLAMASSVRMFRDAAAIIREIQPQASVMGTYSLPLWRKNRFQDPTLALFNIMERTNWDHLDAVYDVCDYIGVNYYYTQDANLFRFLRRAQGELNSNYTQLGWEINPEGLYRILDQVWKRYEKPIVITENGLGTLSEQKRIRYLRQHVSQMRRAMSDGVDIRGYFVWTLVDNYEWKEGWKTNFGITFLDPRTGKLVVEPSGIWFREFIRLHPEP